MSEKTVNPAMVTLAREANGMTQTDLAMQLGVSQTLLSKIEAGVKPTTPPILQRLSVILDFPEEFFFQTDMIFGPGLGEFFHRRRQDISTKVIAKAHANINIVIMHMVRLLRSVDLPPVKIRPLLQDELGGPSSIAAAVRASWQIPAGPIANVIRTIEAAGGIVIRCNFGTPQIDAISRWVPGLPPLFFINESLAVDRERMSLCHELGHLIMHAVPNDQMEAEANEFAGAFLIPEDDIAPHWGKVTIDRLAALKPYWRVSMAALLYRATELKKVSAPISKILWAQMNERGYKRQEPLALTPEEPTILRDILELHCTHYGYDLAELSKALIANPSRLMAMYELPESPSTTRPTLRLMRA